MLCLVTLPVLFASCVLNVVAIVLCCIRFASNRKIPQEDNNILGMYCNQFSAPYLYYFSLSDEGE